MSNELFYLDEAGTKQDRELWEELLGEKFPAPRMARRAENALHKTADAQLKQMSVAIDYAFALGRKALKRDLKDSDAAAKAVHDALVDVLPKTLLRIVEAGGEAGLKLLNKKLRASGGQGSGNFGHEGRPGEVGGSGGSGVADKQVWHGGVKEHNSNVTYYSANEDMAKSYVDMSNDRFGSGGELHESKITISKPAPEKTIQKVAKSLGIDNDLYTPASIFDSSLHGEDETTQLVKKLVDRGFDGAILEDIAYGKQIQEKVFIVFNKSLRTAASDEVIIRFDITNPNAIKWAKKHAAELAKNISEKTRQDIADAIVTALEEGNLREAREDILEAVGNEARATLIARTEIMVATNEGQRQSWDQAIDKGLLTGDEKKEWIATEGACPECEVLDGTLADIDGEYDHDGGDGPPLHPNCRCTEGIR